MAEKVYDLDLSLGFRTFRIKFEEFEEPVEIRFNPSDADLPKRLLEAEKRIRAYAEKVGDVEIGADGELEFDDNGVPKTDALIEQMNGLNEAIYESVDYAFGNRVSDELFVHCSPMAITNGQPFIMQFFEAITPVLRKIITSDQNAANSASAKYLKKYGLGK